MTSDASLKAPRFTEVQAKSLLRESVLVDPWFLGRFGANLYRGCEHGCIYCDGRAERYYVEGDFERDIQVKVNALELAQAALRKFREPGFLFLGGGVSDSYQSAEAKYGLARGLLKLAVENALSVHVLTKSALVERDFDLLSDIAKRRRTILSFSLQSVDDKIRQSFEPRSASVAERLRLLERGRSLGMNGGIFAMPILPGISDQPDQIDELVRRSKDAGAEFICFGGLTLRPGRQKELYYDHLRAHFPELVAGYDKAYGQERASGAPDHRFSQKVTRRFAESLNKHGLTARIPRHVFHGAVPTYTEAAVLLEHVEMEAMLHGQVRPLMRAGHALSKWAYGRLVTLSRRKGTSYRDVESEFLCRLREGTLTQIDGITPDAVECLKSLGFET